MELYYLKTTWNTMYILNHNSCLVFSKELSRFLYNLSCESYHELSAYSITEACKLGLWLSFFKIYLFIWKLELHTEREREKEESEKNLSSTNLLPKWTQWPGFDLAEAGIFIHMTARTQTYGPSSTVFPKSLAGRCIMGQTRHKLLHIWEAGITAGS